MKKWLGLLCSVVLVALLAAPLCAAQQGCERIIQVVLDTGTADQVTQMANASKRFDALRKAGLLEDDLVQLGEDMISVIDANRGTNAQITIHDLMTLVLNGNIDDAHMVQTLRALNKLRLNGNLLPGILTKPGPVGDGSTRLILNIKTGNLGHAFEPVAALYFIENLGEVPIGMGGRVFDNANNFLIEGDFISESRVSLGRVKLVDFKSIDGNWSVDEVVRAKTAILKQAKLQLGANTYEVGEFAFGVRAGESVPSDVLDAIDAANAELFKEQLPLIKIVSNIPF